MVSKLLTDNSERAVCMLVGQLSAFVCICLTLDLSHLSRTQTNIMCDGNKKIEDDLKVKL